jgi:ribosome-associated translation inhibitor RaiA
MTDFISHMPQAHSIKHPTQNSRITHQQKTKVLDCGISNSDLFLGWVRTTSSLAPSEQMEAEIRRHVEKLETRHSHLIGCRVSVERLHTQHRTGNVIDVHVVLSLPGGDLAVSREPHHAKDRFAHADAYLSIREAFRAAKRQLSQPNRGGRRT